MPDGQPDSELDDVVLTEAGAIPREEFDLRQTAGTAAPEISEATLLEARRAELVEETETSPLTTGLERFGSSLTFGGLDFLASEEERESRRRRVEADPLAAVGGEVFGAVLPSVVAPGTGAFSAFAKLTPQGKIAAMGAKFASGGRTGAQRFARQVGAGAFEGAAEGFGNELARQSLSESPDFSAETLLSGAGRGAAIGGGLAGVFAGAGIAKRAIAGRRAAADTPLERLAQADADALAKKEVSVSDLVSNKGRQDTPEAFAGLVGKIDDAKRAVKGDEVDKLVSKGGVALSVAERDTLQGMLRNLDEASERAGKWATDFTDEIGIDDITRATREDLAKPVSQAIDDEGAIALAALDDQLDTFNRTLAETRTTHGVATKSDKKLLALSAPPPTAVPVPEEATPGLLSRGVDTGTSVLGAAEIARDLGVDTGLPSIRNIPVFGEAVSLFTKLKAGSRALGGAGIRVPRTAATGAAQQVNTAKQRIGKAVSKAARGAAVVITSRVARRAGTVGTRKLMSEVMRADPADVGAHAQQAAAGAPMDVQRAAATSARNTLDYLQQTAPVNPMEGTPWGESWEPAELDAMEWQRRYVAALDPESAIVRILTDPGALVEAETVRATAPGLWRETRSALITRIDELAENLPQNRALAIGRAFAIPLHQTLAPGYGRFDIAEVPERGAPTGGPGRPLSGPNPNASPLATGDEV